MVYRKALAFWHHVINRDQRVSPKGGSKDGYMASQNAVMYTLMVGGANPDERHFWRISSTKPV